MCIWRRFRPATAGGSIPDLCPTRSGGARPSCGSTTRTTRAALERIGWTIAASEATFYLWIRAAGGDDVGLTERLMRAGLVALPGSFLGPGGEGYVRWALVPTLGECREAISRLESVENR